MRPLQQSKDERNHESVHQSQGRNLPCTRLRVVIIVPITLVIPATLTTVSLVWVAHDHEERICRVGSDKNVPTPTECDTNGPVRRQSLLLQDVLEEKSYLAQSSGQLSTSSGSKMYLRGE